MATVLGVLTDFPGGLLGARRVWQQMIGGPHLVSLETIAGGYFKMGTYNIAGSPGPLDDQLSDLVAPEATSQKTLTADDVTWVSPRTLRIRCFLDSTEGNGAGSVTYYEIGVFDTAGRMCVHAVVTAQPKNNGLTLENYVNVIF